MKQKKIICILLAIILILSFSITSFATDINQETNYANQVKNTEENNAVANTKTNDITELNNQKSEIEDKINQANQELEYVQGEISETLIQIQELGDKITKYEEENKQLAETLKKLETSIEETSKRLEIVTEDYTKKEEQLRNRMVALYEAGDISYLDVLLSANSLSDFLSIYYAMIEIAEYDNALIEKVDEQRKEIDIAKRRLENESAQVKILKAKAEQNETIVSNTKTLQEGYIQQLSEKEQKINTEIMQYKAYSASIEARIQEISMGTGDINIQYTGGTMIWPVAKVGTAISSYYGTREHPIQGIIKFHQGIDIANTGFGAPVVAALDGVVTYAGWLGSYGNCVMIYHGDGITTLYGHGQAVLTEYGAEVKQGDVIMETGSTGNSTGPHLHFEVRMNGTTANPLQYVKEP